MMSVITLNEILTIHRVMIDIGGGAQGIRDIGLVLSAIARPFSTFGEQDLYPDIYTKAATLLQSLACNHGFIDGNKRTAYFGTLRFLAKNSIRLYPPEDEIITFMLQVTTQGTEVGQIASWLRSHAT